MPELPEVETVRRGLEPEMVGRAITKVVVRRPDLRFRFPENFAQRITGHTVKAVSRRSKYIWIHLSSGETLIVHLGMSGQVNIDHDGTREIGKHNHVSFFPLFTDSTDCGTEIVNSFQNESQRRH